MFLIIQQFQAEWEKIFSTLRECDTMSQRSGSEPIGEEKEIEQEYIGR